MAERRFNTSLVVSASAHAAVLLWTAVSFAARPLDTPPTDAVYVDTISMSDFSKMTAGVKTAPPKETPKPLVEKKAEPKPVENHAAPVEDKPEIITASAPAEPPPAPVKPPPPKPAPAEAAPKVQPPEKKQPDAESLKKNEKKEVKKEEKKQEAKPLPPKPPTPPKKPAEKKPEREPSKFSADQIASLLDKRAPRRMAAAGQEINNTPTAGTPRGTAPQLSQNEIDALRARLGECWQTLGGDLREESLKIPITLRFRVDGSLSSPPQIDMPLRTTRERIMAEGIVRAITGCAPFTMLSREKYETWKELAFNFDPKNM